ncbi:MAG: DUF6198 family protein [Oscillospiraceae bacterium]|nr:DUF6198 family protein [Oscillospiraceae bacterium]
MKKLAEERLPQRIGLYFFAMVLLSIGVVFNVNADLGVSPINVLPFVTSRITGITLGTASFLIFLSYTLTQILLLRRDFQCMQLTQLLVSALVGVLIDFTAHLLGDFQLPGYVGQLTQLLIGIFLVGCGVALHMKARLITLPPAATVMAITQKLPNGQFHKVKIVFDCTMVALATALSFAFLGNITGIREGTAISALLMGRLLPFINRAAAPALRKLGLEESGK